MYLVLPIWKIKTNVSSICHSPETDDSRLIDFKNSKWLTFVSYYAFVIVTLFWLAFFLSLWLFLLYEFTRFLFIFCLSLMNGLRSKRLSLLSISAVHQVLFIFQFLSEHCLRSTLHVRLVNYYVICSLNDPWHKNYNYPINCCKKWIFY